MRGRARQAASASSGNWSNARPIGARYDALIDAAGIERVTVRPDRSSVFAQYTVLVDDRARVQGELQAAGVPTAVHYPMPLHLQPAYRETSPPVLPASEAAAARVMSLPMHPDLESSVQARIVQSLASSVQARTQASATRQVVLEGVR